eukprot:8751575-Alexandrium_andersonii.AAC.1
MTKTTRGPGVVVPMNDIFKHVPTARAAQRSTPSCEAVRTNCDTGESANFHVEKPELGCAPEVSPFCQPRAIRQAPVQSAAARGSSTQGRTRGAWTTRRSRLQSEISK